MIQKEQIQKRRHELAEVRHAESVYRDIIDRENERVDYEKRWFWELLQNAKDSIDEDETVKVKIEISDNQISFSHTGTPFELDDILSLIIQGSSKNKKNKTGRFGTGFITTYLLSKEVGITGCLTNNEGYFRFILNRNATNSDDFYNQQQESNNLFEESIRTESYLGDDEFQTKFTYNLDAKGKETARIGLECLDELIPITQLFNRQIESVVVIEDNHKKTFSKNIIQEYNSISEFEIQTYKDNSIVSCCKSYVYHGNDYDSCVITSVNNSEETIFSLSPSYPRLYFTFPLIGTEEIGIPIIINSEKFKPRIERDGIYLKDENAPENKEIIKHALLFSLSEFLKLFLQKGIKGTYKLFSLNRSKDLKWIDIEWLGDLKKETFKMLASQTVIRENALKNSYCNLNEMTIPYSDKKEDKNGNILAIWKLLCNLKDKKVPIVDELFYWVDIIENNPCVNLENNKVSNQVFAWDLNKLIHFIEQKKKFFELNESLKTDTIDWLNAFYSIIAENFPLEKSILLNQRGDLVKAASLKWDECNDETLVSISDLIELNYADKLISREIRQIYIAGIEKFQLQNAITEVTTRLNNLNESEVKIASNQEGNAKFLKWLILKNNKDAIKNIKVFTGYDKNEQRVIYDFFPKQNHLMLSPKGLFGVKFPLYATLIRDKDCMNDFYNTILEENNFVYLNNNGFIHIQPLVIRTEKATVKMVEDLIVNEDDLALLKDSEGQLKEAFELQYSDFAYLTASDGHIYARNTSQKSSLERLRFFLNEAIEKDPLFDMDEQLINIGNTGHQIFFRQCLWISRAKRLSWVNIRTETENSEIKFAYEMPSSKNLSELLKMEEPLIKVIRSSRAQCFFNKLNVGVSDLIRNTLPTEELKISWDKAITNMITSDIRPELVQEIFNDPNIRKEYERRLREKEIINRNQSIGSTIEKLFKEYIELLCANGVPIKIKRKPFGSDYILTDDSSDIVNENNEREGFEINSWLIEMKATGREYASMTPLQAETATKNQENYALIIVPLDGRTPDIEYIRQNAKIVCDIGCRINQVYPDFKDIESKKGILNTGQEGISVNIEDQNIRFRVNSTIWKDIQMDIKTFVEEKIISL